MGGFRGSECQEKDGRQDEGASEFHSNNFTYRTSINDRPRHLANFRSQPQNMKTSHLPMAFMSRFTIDRVTHSRRQDSHIKWGHTVCLSPPVFRFIICINIAHVTLSAIFVFVR